MSGIRFTDLAKSYEKGKPVLRDIDFTIESGELFFLLGPSGCGKSTLLRLIAGFIQPDQGIIYLGDRDVTSVPVEKRQTGMVFQNYALWPHLTVYENVAFGLRIKGGSREQEKKAVHDILDKVGLAALAERKPASLSGGQQQRVALARAVVIEPEVLLLDEPLSNLDAKLRVNMRSEIRHICKSAGLTTVYVTHDQKEALSMADRVAILNNGVIEQIGKPYDLYHRPVNRFVADFIGEGNFLDVTITQADNDTCVIASPLGELHSRNCHGQFKSGDDAILVVRPESIAVSDCGDEQHTNTFKATIQDGQFLGEMSQWKVECGAVTLQVAEMNPEPREIGASCVLTVKPEHLIVLPC